MANTHKAIATTTVGSGGASSIDFTSIPGTYTDLKVVMSARTSAAVGADNCVVNISFNDSTSSFTNKYIEFYGSGIVWTTTGTRLVAITGGTLGTANTFMNGEIYIPNYTSSSNKAYLTNCGIVTGKLNIFICK